MRLPAVMLAAGLAACQVDVEGAICAVPGDASECPSGQACGVDGRCSTRAASCMAPELRCTPDVDRRCSADAKRVETCTRADPCGAWEVTAAADDCSAAQLVCAAGACACPMPAGEIVVDVASPEGGLAPSGAADPPECRFKQLGPALSYAAGEWQPAHAGAPVTVRAVGAPTPEAPVVFEDEELPLVIGTDVTLAPQGADPAGWVIAGTPPASGSIVTLGGGARLEGFTIRGGGPGYGISVSCAPTVDATVHRVVVDGGGSLSRGITVADACGLVASDLRVADVAGQGLWVDAWLLEASVPAVGVRIDGGWIEGCGASGIELRGGALTLNQVVIRGNAGFGVKARTRDENPKRAIALEINDSTLEANGEAGLLVRALEAGSSLAVRRSVFTRNRATTPQETEFTSGRRVGGVYLYGAPPSELVFEGNRVYANANDDAEVIVDQLATVAGATWDLSGPATCGALANVFACPGNGRLVYGSGVSPSVRRAYWPTAPPSAWPPVTLVENADFDPTCPFDATPIPACTP
jgi:hypothetical protein